MNKYETAMIKLKIFELAQNQTLIFLSAMAVNSVDANLVADESLSSLDVATEYVEKLIKEQ